MSSIATIGTIDGTVRATALVPVTEPDGAIAIFIANERSMTMTKPTDEAIRALAFKL
jgi:hypothetical protein